VTRISTICIEKASALPRAHDLERRGALDEHRQGEDDDRQADRQHERVGGRRAEERLEALAEPLQHGAGVPPEGAPRKAAGPDRVVASRA
jgi:hypothetical protein